MRIKRLTYFDFPKIKRMVSYLCSDETDKLAKSILEESFGFINAILPLTLKFKSESFIYIENNEILGLITAVKTKGNPYKLIITRLIFKENLYDVGKQLVEFVVNKYGALGARTFTVSIDECHDELLNLFINGCGFRQCSSETLWKIENPDLFKSDFKLRYAQSSDADKIASLYNSELCNIYSYSLSRTPQEFRENFFSGFNDFYKSRYIKEEAGKILGYFSVTTSDNLNYIIDITTNSAYDYDYDVIINALLCEIAGKKKNFYPLLKQKNYTNNAEKFGQYLKLKNYNPIQTRHILVKDYYKPIEQESPNWNVFILGEGVND